MKNICVPFIWSQSQQGYFLYLDYISYLLAYFVFLSALKVENVKNSQDFFFS